MTLLDVSDLVATTAAVLHGVALQVEMGEIVTLMGHNGAGKTTTIRSVLGAVRPRSGTVRIAGRDTTRRPVRNAVAAGVAMTPQNASSSPTSPSTTTSYQAPPTHHQEPTPRNA